MNIALHMMGSDDWPAGRVVLELMFRALRAAEADRTFLTAWQNQPSFAYAELAALADEIVSIPGGDGNRHRLTETLKNAGVEVFFSLPTPTALHIELPEVIWPYDFQHIHFPGNFPPAERHRRSALFLANFHKANRILLYSEAVFHDLAAFAPQCASKGRIIRFVPSLPEYAWLNAGDLTAFNLPTPFFYLPNSLQPHKNHGIVIDALALLAKRGIKTCVVCTGAESPEHDTSELRARVDAAQLGDSFRFLGHVPRSSVFALMRNCTALINPSLFEGFGLGIAEAGYLGTPLILSRIPALEEHRFPGTSYFDPQSASELAQSIEKQLGRPDRPTAPPARAAYLADQQAFGKSLHGLFQEACS